MAMKRSLSDGAANTVAPAKRTCSPAAHLDMNDVAEVQDIPGTASGLGMERNQAQGSASHSMMEFLQSARRGVAYVYLHYIYQPCCYRRRVKEVRDFLAKRRTSSSQLPVEEVVQTAERSPFRANLPSDARSFLEPAEIHQRPEPSQVFQALPTRRSALRSALESRRIRLIDSMFSRPDPGRRNFFSRIPLRVRRGAVFDSVVEALLAATPTQSLAGVHVRFVGLDNTPEVGVDSGGLSREFFNVVLDDLVDSETVMEAPSLSAPSSSQLSRMSSVEGFMDPMFREQADNALMLISSCRPLAVYHALGRLIAVALVHASYGDLALPYPLNDCLLKYIVGQPISATDVRRRDPLYYKNRIDALLRPGGIEQTAAALCVERLVFEEADVELKPGGARLPVTPDNVREYVALLSEEYVCGKVRKELAQFLAGFHYVVPQEILQESCISFADLGVLLSGVPELDVNAWCMHAVVRAAGVEPHVANQMIDWLWVILEAWPQEDRGAVLAFATGCSRLPAVGFSRLDPPFTVEVVPNQLGNALPTAHTCFNCLSLPVYPSQKVLDAKLAIAAREGHVGFSML